MNSKISIWLKNFLKRHLNLFFLFNSWFNKKEYERQKLVRLNERPVEYAFVFKKIAEIYPKTILDIGAGVTALPSLMRGCGQIVTATDNIKDYWPRGMTNPHYHILNDDITKTRLKKKFDLITCVSVLEHIVNFDDAVCHMASLLNAGGHLILTFPYCEKHYVGNVYKEPGSIYGKNAAYITQAFSRNEIDRWVKDFGFEILAQEYWNFWSGNFWTVGREIVPPRKVTAKDTHHISCILFKKT